MAEPRRVKEVYKQGYTEGRELTQEEAIGDHMNLRNHKCRPVWWLLR